MITINKAVNNADTGFLKSYTGVLMVTRECILRLFSKCIAGFFSSSFSNMTLINSSSGTIHAEEYKDRILKFREI